MAAGGPEGTTMVDAEALGVLQAVRAAAPGLEYEWREGSDVSTWKRVKWTDSGSVSEL
jgi:hypothetical protein